jgi:proline iminopeptidase
VLARGRIGAHYFMNRYFLDGQLLVNADRLRGVPGVIVQGTDDAVTPSISAYDLHGAWPESRLEIVNGAGHSSVDSALMRALVDATDSLLPIARARLARRRFRWTPLPHGG